MGTAVIAYECHLCAARANQSEVSIPALPRDMDPNSLDKIMGKAGCSQGTFAGPYLLCIDPAVSATNQPGNWQPGNHSGWIQSCNKTHQ